MPTLRKTRQQFVIEDVVRKSGRALSPSEILEAGSVDVPTLSLATVYRAVRRMQDDGVLMAVELPGEPPRYEHRDSAIHHHHYFKCERCDHVKGLKGDRDDLKHLLPEDHRFHRQICILYGVCPDCQSIV